MPAGILLIDKPHGLTSHDVVARSRRLLGTRKVGHAGTLDPMATGLLILGVDSATRLLHYIVGLEKEYLATIRLGQSSSTDDAEGELGQRASAEALAAITEAEIAEAMAQLRGEISQVPSTVSAIKVDGERAYARVRAGEHVELAARSVTVREFELGELRRGPDAIELDVRVVCSSGTYIRALARDLGNALAVGGHLTMLRRSRIGQFRVDDAHRLDQFESRESRDSRDMHDTLDPARIVIPSAVAAAALMPVVRVDAQQAIDLGHGKRIQMADAPASGVPGSAASASHAREQAAAPFAAAINHDGQLIAIIQPHGETWKVACGFPPEAPAASRPDAPVASPHEGSVQ